MHWASGLPRAFGIWPTSACIFTEILGSIQLFPRKIGGNVNVKHIRIHWEEILWLSTSIKQGTVTASLMLRKLGSYPRQNGMAIASRELGRIERTLFALDWIHNAELRQ